MVGEMVVVEMVVREEMVEVAVGVVVAMEEAIVKVVEVTGGEVAAVTVVGG